jgi:insulysin
MSQNCIDKEINAINNEFVKSINNEEWRFFQLMKHISHVSSPFAKFTIGNTETLYKPDSYAKLLEFFNSKYSSNVMKLVVYSNESLDSMVQSVSSIFSPIKNRSLPRISYTEQPLPFTAENTCKLVRMLPLATTKSIKLIWVFESLLKHYRSHPLKVLSHLIGHESEGSILHLLKQQNLALALSSSMNNIADLSTLYYIDIELTDMGFENIPKVLEVVGGYISKLQTIDVPKYVFEEIQRINSIQFDFEDKSDPMDKVLKVMENMIYFPVHECNVVPYLMENYEPEVYKKYASRLTIDLANVFLSSPTFTDLPGAEPYYKISHSVHSFPDEWKLAFNSQTKSTMEQLFYPHPNMFIPKNFELLYGEEDHTESLPEALLCDSDSGNKLYFKPDAFGLPKICLRYQLFVPLKNTSLDQRTAYSIIWRYILVNYMKTILYNAEEADLVFELTMVPKGAVIRMSGYSDSMAHFLEEFNKKFKEFKCLEASESGLAFLEEQFSIYKTKSLNWLDKRSKKEPSQLAHNSLDWILLHTSYSEDVITTAVREISFENYLKFHSEFLHDFIGEGLILGNVSKDQALAIDFQFRKVFAQFGKTPKLPKDSLAKSHILHIAPNSTYVLEKDIKIKNESNNCILIYFQLPTDKDYRELLDILGLFINNPFFEELRTNQQLGYVVNSYAVQKKHVWGHVFLIQSDRLLPNEIAHKIYEFVDTYREKAVNLEADKFDGFKSSAISNLRQPFMNICEETDHYFKHMQNHYFDFGQVQKSIEKIQAMTIEEFKDFYEQIFYRERRVLEVNFVNESSKEGNYQALIQRIYNSPFIHRVEHEDTLKKILPFHNDPFESL